MSATHDDDRGDKKSISVRIDDKFLNKFDIALKQAQIEGNIDMGMSRSEAIRKLMRAAEQDMSLLSEVQDLDTDSENNE